MNMLSIALNKRRISADQILGFIDTSLHDYGYELDSVQQKLLEYEQKNNLIDVESQSGNYLRISVKRIRQSI